MIIYQLSDILTCYVKFGFLKLCLHNEFFKCGPFHSGVGCSYPPPPHRGMICLKYFSTNQDDFSYRICVSF